MIRFSTYRVAVKHDRGVASLAVRATNANAARSIVMATERCPLRAIISVKKITRPAPRRRAASRVIPYGYASYADYRASRGKKRKNPREGFKRRRRYISSKGSRIYVGVRGGFREVFHSVFTPTEASHGHLYGAVIGPFRTFKAARIMAHYGGGNPQLQSVADAERLAKRPFMGDF